jgi:hypothetical protein
MYIRLIDKSACPTDCCLNPYSLFLCKTRNKEEETNNRMITLDIVVNWP